jgi:hypothetical protein
VTERLYSGRGIEVWHAEWRDLLAALPKRADGTVADALIVDAPYSERTHAGHDGAAAAEEGAVWVRSNGRAEAKIQRRDINYTAWTSDDVRGFVVAAEPLVRGWMVSLTDDELFPHWRREMGLCGRQTFGDVPAVIRGMTVRLNGDGPSSWAIHIAVSRPRNLVFAKWGTLCGGYDGPSERQPVVGGKPLWLMRALVRDYTRPGDLVIDPCAGGGTTALACALEGRRCVTGDSLREHAELAVGRVRALPQDDPRTGQRALFGEGM